MRDFAEMARLIREHEIGRRETIETPFGRRLVCYADLTATGRYLRFVDDWLRAVRPFYANTHTEVSTTGRIVTALRERSREVIRRAVNAADDDEVLFVGAGATAGANKLVGLLGLRISESLDRSHGLSASIPREQRPVVFVGPYEHHSNELPWRESIADLVEIALDAGGAIDLTDLERRMEQYVERPLKVGSFSAASNVTGLLSDVRGISRVLHSGGAFAIFDYAAAAPYVPIDMHPPAEEERIDALFLSAHKFIGGPQASGLLVANRRIFLGHTPVDPGGGTVDYVAGPGPDDVDYVRQLDLREEAGTPAIMGDVTAGAAFLVKEMMGPARIHSHEISITERAVARLAAHPAITVLGPHDLPRLAIVPITIEGLHHDFASALLDHLFGIQNRGGCSCAGPYGHRLLGIDRDTSNRFRELVRRGIHGMKPGWVRLSLPYYASDEDLEFILSAVEFVADHGTDFLPVYRLDWRDGVWRHVDRDVEEICPVELSIEGLTRFASVADGGAEEPAPTEPRIRAERARYLDEARSAAGELRRQQSLSPSRFNPPTGNRDIDDLVWFRFIHAEGL